MFDTFKALDLQLFDGAAAAPAAPASAGGEASGATSQGAAAPASGENTQAAAVTEQSTLPKVKTYTEDEVQTILKGRLEKAKGNEDTLAKLGPIVEMMGAKYGVDASDLSKADLDMLYKKIADDDSLYEEEAEKRGMSVEATKQLVRLERENARYKQQEAANAEEMMMRQHFGKLATQAAELAPLYGNVDLSAELQNPTFARLVSPAVGIDVKTAYELVHKAELESAVVSHAVQQTAQKMSNAVQSGSQRPRENGMTDQPASNITNDPRTWTKEYRKSLRERVRRGERIVF